MLSRLRLKRLRFSLEVSAPAQLPPYKGDLLRRALLWHLGSIWCRERDRCRERCQQPRDCLFGLLLEPVPDPNWSQPLQRLMGSTPPPAYVLWDDQNRRRQVEPGDPFSFELTLIGDTAAHQHLAFVAAVLAGAEAGMGRQRLKARLRGVEALIGSAGRAVPLFEDGVWQGDAGADLEVGFPDGQSWADGVGPVTRLQLSFLSPVNIKMRGKQVRRPEFPALARAMVRRLRILSEVHGVGEWPRDEYGPLLDLADGVRLEHHETSWISRARYSQRGGRMPWQGFVGQAWYASDADLAPLLPVLWLGQWLHIGKAYVLGSGRYTIEALHR